MPYDKKTYAKEWREKNREKSRSYTKKWRDKNPLAYIEKRYGITREQYDQMLAQQDGKCAVCKDTLIGRPRIDHCHKTGGVRGLLCHSCNIALGLMRDRVEVLEAAILYLKRFHDDRRTADSGLHQPDQNNRSAGTTEPLRRSGSARESSGAALVD